MVQWSSISLFLMLLAGWPMAGICNSTQTAVVATVAADYSSGAHSVIAVDPVGGPREARNELLPTISDITVTAHKNHFYRIERFQRNNITKFDIAAPDTVIWQFSALDPGESDSNPYDLVFTSDEKAYLLRYGTTSAWIVNPAVAADQHATFKIGALDLSAYADTDGIPEMNAAAVAEGKLFIVMQRLNQDAFWAPENDAYVAVFDIATDTEIDTGTPNDDGLKGIRLPIRNTGAIQYLAADNAIYVQGVGDWGFNPDQYPSGIVRIDPDTYAVEMVVAGGAPHGSISGMSIVSPQKGYFVGYAGWGDNTLYAFNPSTGEIFGPAHPQLSNINIAGMETGAYTDRNSMLWVCNQTDAELVILNTATDEVDEIVYTGLNPTRVAFTTEGEPGGDVGGGGSSGCFIDTAFNGEPTDVSRGSIVLLLWLGVTTCILLILGVSGRHRMDRHPATKGQVTT